MARLESAARCEMHDRSSALPPGRQQASGPRCNGNLLRAHARRRDGSRSDLEYRLLETVRSDFAFFKSMGIAPCLIDRPLPLPYFGRVQIRLTGVDAKWLKACGVAWEPEPAFRLPLDFCGNQRC